MIEAIHSMLLAVPKNLSFFILGCFLQTHLLFAQALPVPKPLPFSANPQLRLVEPQRLRSSVKPTPNPLLLGLIFLLATPSEAGDGKWSTLNHLTNEDEKALIRFRDSRLGFAKGAGDPATIEDLIEWLLPKQKQSPNRHFQINEIKNNASQNGAFKNGDSKDGNFSSGRKHMEDFEVPVEIHEIYPEERLIRIKDLHSKTYAFWPMNDFEMQENLVSGQRLTIRFSVRMDDQPDKNIRQVESYAIQNKPADIIHRFLYDSEFLTSLDMSILKGWGLGMYKKPMEAWIKKYSEAPLPEDLRPTLRRPWVPTRQEYDEIQFNILTFQADDLSDIALLRQEEERESLWDQSEMRRFQEAEKRYAKKMLYPYETIAIHSLDILIKDPRFKVMFESLPPEEKEAVELLIRRACNGNAEVARLLVENYLEYKNLDELADLSIRYRNLGFFNSPIK